uniref:Uncharacterized protein LOC101503643 n=1 Tax=Cicer arietinum TaxID=3827 RepID=A0A1S2YHQ1_CICAR|nr:uncharacterized protein LOC101503643 [Cicer arietinum]
MASVVNETSDSESHKGWMSLSTISTPPLQLVAIIGIVMFLLWTSSYVNMQTTSTTINFFLLFLSLVITLIAQFARYVAPTSNVITLEGGDGGQSTWGSVALLMLLLVYISNRLHPIFVIAIVFLYMYILSV